MSKDSFASLMASGSAAVADRARKRLERGQTLDVTVLQVSGEFVYVDVGTAGDGKIPAIELSDETATARQTGDTVRASVVEADPTGACCAPCRARKARTCPSPTRSWRARYTRVENYLVSQAAPPRATVWCRCAELGLAPGAYLRKPFRSAKS